MTNYDALASKAVEGFTVGGFTLAFPDGSAPNTGYVLSTVKDRERVFAAGELTVSAVASYIADNVDLLSEPGLYLGGWEWDGAFYLDISRIVYDLPSALTIARQHDQIAIWDIAGAQEIFC